MLEATPGQLAELAARNLWVDQLTAEIADLFADAGIECMLMKGPVIASWLYEGHLRPYVDSDLLIARSDWDRATRLLAQHGFTNHLAPLAHPRMESMSSTAYVRGTQNLDLHATFAGLGVGPEDVWTSLRESADELEVGGRRMAVPSRPAILVHLALHAAHHHEGPKPLEDLRRGLQVATFDEWRQATELAGRLDALPAFASGLRRLPQGFQLARELGIENVSSLIHDLRASAVPTAEGLNQLLGPGLSLAERRSMVLGELIPTQAFMRSWTGLARRGRRGLVAAYLLRWTWLARNVPRGLIALYRTQRRQASK